MPFVHQQGKDRFTYQQPVSREPTLSAEVAANRTLGRSLMFSGVQCRQISVFTARDRDTYVTVSDSYRQGRTPSA